MIAFVSGGSFYRDNLQETCLNLANKYKEYHPGIYLLSESTVFGGRSLEDEPPVRVTDPKYDYDYNLTWSPDGKKLPLLVFPALDQRRK